MGAAASRSRLTDSLQQRESNQWLQGGAGGCKQWQTIFAANREIFQTNMDRRHQKKMIVKDQVWLHAFKQNVDNVQLE